jgi:hypothetical protein
MDKFKFWKNDRFVVSDSGLEGTVRDVSFNSIKQEDEYIVEWDSQPGRLCGYSVIDVEPIWNYYPIKTKPLTGSPKISINGVSIEPMKTVSLSFYPKNIPLDNTIVCAHAWKNSTSEPGKTQWCSLCDARK